MLLPHSLSQALGDAGCRAGSNAGVASVGSHCVSSFLAEQNIIQSLSRDFTVSNSASVDVSLSFGVVMDRCVNTNTTSP